MEHVLFEIYKHAILIISNLLRECTKCVDMLVCLRILIPLHLNVVNFPS